MIKSDFAILNAVQIVSPSGEAPVTGKRMKDLKIINNGGIASLKGKIVFIGTMDELKKNCITQDAEVVDASGKVVLPGFVDPHTHIVFGGFREIEFNRRIEGATYEQIAAEGGGIRSTVRATRESSEDELLFSAQNRIDQALSHGTTSVEIKSGYGLSVKDELKLLRVVRKLKLNNQNTIDIIPTFLGAHTIPAEFSSNREDYCRLVMDEMLPAVAEEGLAEFCDVFCETTAFTLEESRQILMKAAELGMKLKIHADQLSASGGSALACELGTVSAEHLEYIGDKEIHCMAEKKIAAILLPGAAFFIRQGKYPPARKIIESGVPVALATDCNPGSCFTTNMAIIMTLAVLEMGMTIEEAVTASTLNSAYSINRHFESGSLEIGKNLDAVLLDIPNFYHLVYNWGINHVSGIVKRGRPVYTTLA